MDTNPSHFWQLLFPPLQAFDSGWLDVGDGHQLHWDCSCQAFEIPLEMSPLNKPSITPPAPAPPCPGTPAT